MSTVTHAAIIREMDAEELEEYYSEQKAAYEKINDLPFDVPFGETSFGLKIQTVFKQLTGKTITQ